MIDDYSQELEKISNNCSLCRAKMCHICNNDKRKKFLKEKIKNLQKDFEKKGVIEKIKKFFSKKY